jgi:hypothetical protein
MFGEDMVILNLKVEVHLMISEIERVNSFIEMISEIKGIVMNMKTVRIVEFGKK